MSRKQNLHSALVCALLVISSTVSSTSAWASIVSSVLPSSRSIGAGETATVFASVINAGSNAATGCTVVLASNELPISLSFSPTNASTNEISGPAQTPVDIAANATATFLLSITAASAFDPAHVEFQFDCDNTEQAPNVTGINTLLLSASEQTSADLITLIATPSADGVMRIDSALGSQFLAMATSNVGDADTLVLTAESGSKDMPAQFLVCETDPVTSRCLGPQAPAVTLSVPAGATPTFAVFAYADGGAVFAPENNRVFVRFRDPTGAVRGSSSAAFTAPTPESFTNTPKGLWQGLATEDDVSMPIFFAISESGELRYLSDTGSLGTADVSWDDTQFGGIGSAYAPRGFIWAATGTRDAGLSLQGDYSTRGAISANFFLGDRVRGTISLDYDPAYEQPSAIKLLQGQWNLRDYVDGTDIGDIQISASGHLTGRDGFNCDYNGLVSIINSDFNLYRVGALITGCGASDGYYTGLGTLTTDRSLSDTFVFALESGNSPIINSLTRF